MDALTHRVGRPRNGASYRKGTSIVEMAIVSTLLMLLTLGTVEYGWMFLKQQQIAWSARQAVRLGAMPGGAYSSVTGQVTTLMTTYGLNTKGYVTTVTLNGTTVTDLSTANTGDVIGVQVSIPYSNIAITHFTLLPVPTNISATVSMEREG